MNSWKTVKLLGSAALPRAIHWHGLFTAGAMLTCVAVALNAGPFAKIPKPSLSAENAAGEVALVTMQANVSHPISAPDFEPPTLLADSQSAMQVADTLESIHPSKESLLESSPRAAVELASSASQPGGAEPRSADLQGQSPRDEPGLIDSATYHQADDANSGLL